MKKILLAIALVLTMGFGAKAQIGLGLTDSFFNDWAQSDLMREVTLINLPTDHGLTGDVNAPLGSGLLVLTALGAGYAVARRKRD
jgi:hypothetical protein